MRKNFILLLFITSSAVAQNVSDSATVRRDYNPTALNFSCRTEYYLNKEYLWLGYEHKASEKWYFGISGRALQFPKETSFITRINISHRGKISSLGFLKELTLEQVSTKSNRHYGRVGLAMGLYKKLKIGKATIIPMLSYKAYEIFDLKNPNNYFKNRFIDLTRMRFDIYFMAHKNVYLGIYAMRETEYYYALGYSVPDQYNPSVIAYTVPDYKVNSITPTFGFSLNFIVKPENNSALIPGFPLR
jgi:hypothetical protein